MVGTASNEGFVAYGKGEYGLAVDWLAGY